MGFGTSVLDIYSESACRAVQVLPWFEQGRAEQSLPQGTGQGLGLKGRRDQARVPWAAAVVPVLLALLNCNQPALHQLRARVKGPDILNPKSSATLCHGVRKL